MIVTSARAKRRLRPRGPIPPHRRGALAGRIGRAHEDVCAVPFGPQGWEWVDEAAGRFGLTGAFCERAIAGEPVTLHLACH